MKQGELDMKISVKTPTIYPIIVPASILSLQTYNFYLVENEGTLFLIDAGEDSDACWQGLLHVLQQHDLTLQNIDAIVLTHNHSDHIGLVNRILKQHDVPLYVHPNAVIRLKRDRVFLEKRALFYEGLYKEMGCGTEADALLERLKTSIDRNASKSILGDMHTVREGDVLFGFTVTEVPGHAPDHIALFHEESGIMFVGDHIIQHSPSNALVEIGEDGKRTPSLLMYEQSLKKLFTFPLTTAYSGHGETIIDPHELVQMKLKRIENKSKRMLSLLHEPRTAAAIAKEMYTDRYEKLLPLVMSEVVGHLDRLHALGEVTTFYQDGILFFDKEVDTETR